MSENPDLVAAGKTISLAQLGGASLLSSPKKEPVTTRRVVVYPPKQLPVDSFPDDEDETLRLVNLENSAENGDMGKTGTETDSNTTKDTEGGSEEGKTKDNI
jgi:hypothetical protein